MDIYYNPPFLVIVSSAPASAAVFPPVMTFMASIVVVIAMVVIAVVFPVLGTAVSEIAVIVTVPDYRLEPAPVSTVMIAVIIIIHPGITPVDHYFITPVQIIMAIPRWQVGSKNPAAVIQIDEHPSRHIIIHIHIRQIVIIYIIITHGAP